MELQALLQAARYFADGKEINAAISAYRHALLISGEATLPFIYIELARLYEKHRRFDEAGLTYEEASLFREAGNSFMDAHLYDRALACFNKLDKNDLTMKEEVSVFLLKLHLFDVRRLTLEFPVITCNSEDEDTIALNILLESLFYHENENGGDDGIKSNLISQLNPFLDGRQKELLQYFIDQKGEADQTFGFEDLRFHS